MQDNPNSPHLKCVKFHFERKPIALRPLEKTPGFALLSDVDMKSGQFMNKKLSNVLRQLFVYLFIYFFIEIFIHYTLLIFTFYCK